MRQGILLYIDPGTGAMLFTVIMGIVTTLLFAVQKVWLKLKFIFTGGKKAADGAEKMKIVLFTDSKRYWNVFEPVCDELERRQVECDYWTASPDDPALDKKYQFVRAKFIGEGNRAYAKLNMMHADVCLATTPGLDVYQWKRSKNVGYYVHMPHEVGEMTGYRMFGIDYYDAVLLTGQFQETDIRKLEELRALDRKELCVVGSTYMDALQDKLESCAGEKNDTVTVLVAPSWGASSILNRFGAGFLEQLKNTGYRIIVRPHPQSRISDPEMLEKLQRQYPDGDLWSWNYDNDNFQVLREADILISDFSGVLFDFSLAFGKPVIYADTNVDRSPYDSCWIDGEPWRWSVLPRIGSRLRKEDFGRLKEVIDEALSDESRSAERTAVRDVAWQCRGEAAKRVADYLIRKQAEVGQEAS